MSNPRAVIAPLPEHPMIDGLRTLIREVIHDELQALTSSPSKAPKLLLNTDEAAEILNVPATWLAQAARENRIKVTRIGHYVRFKMADLEQFIENQKKREGNENHGSSEKISN